MGMKMIESRRMLENAYLISCDWGTSSFRLRLLTGRDSPKILADRTSARGILSFPARDSDEFQNYLILELDRLFRAAKLSPDPVPIYLSGMITSTLGWKELPYADLPFPLDGTRAFLERALLQRVYGTHNLAFISGVRTADDVLRGEETELMGILQEPSLRKWNGSSIAVLPGTHSKAIEIQDEAIVEFRTYLTGELFDVLRQNSILKHSVDPEPNPEEAALEFFDLGVKRAADQGLSESLFSVRTNVLLKRIPRDLNTLYLSGLLIGTEVRSILDHFPPTAGILLGGKRSLQALYERAFEALGESARIHVVPETITSIATALGHWHLRPVVEEDPFRIAPMQPGAAVRPHSGSEKP